MIQIIEGRCGRDEIIMVVADLKEELVQVPQDGNAAGVFKTAIVYYVAQRSFLNRILLQLHPIVDVDAEISHENIEGDLRLWCDQDSVGIVLGMIEVEGISDAKVEAEGGELGYRQDHVEAQVWSDHRIILRVRLWL